MLVLSQDRPRSPHLNFLSFENFKGMKGGNGMDSGEPPGARGVSTGTKEADEGVVGYLASKLGKGSWSGLCY
jgi:hypothetical protein